MLDGEPSPGGAARRLGRFFTLRMRASPRSGRATQMPKAPIAPKGGASAPSELPALSAQTAPAWKARGGRRCSAAAVYREAADAAAVALAAGDRGLALNGPRGQARWPGPPPTPGTLESRSRCATGCSSPRWPGLRRGAIRRLRRRPARGALAAAGATARVGAGGARRRSPRVGDAGAASRPTTCGATKSWRCGRDRAARQRR